MKKLKLDAEEIVSDGFLKHHGLSFRFCTVGYQWQKEIVKVDSY